MKKLVIISAIAAMCMCAYSCTDKTPLEEMVEEQVEKSKVPSSHDGYDTPYSEPEDSIPAYNEEKE